MESLQIYLNSMSADLYYQNSNSWCEFELPLIECDYRDHIYISVQSVAVPYSFYNVSGYNNFLQYSTINGIVDVFISTGNYNINTLLTALITSLPTFGITYDKIKNKLTFTNTIDFTFTLNSTCFEIIGLSSIVQSSSYCSLTSDYVCNLSTVRHICIATNFYTSNINKALPNERNILCHVPINVGPNEVITWTNQGNYRCNLSTNILSNIVIKILDHQGNVIDLNGGNWSMTLQVDIVNYSEG
jgi:hypothetical protein